MKWIVLILAAAWACAAPDTARPQTDPDSAPCDRACLEGTLERFMDARFGTLSDGRELVSGPSIPWTWQIAEVFKIEHGMIGLVESVLHPVPYGMTSGWSEWSDAMSSEPRWSPAQQ